MSNAIESVSPSQKLPDTVCQTGCYFILCMYVVIAVNVRSHKYIARTTPIVT